MLSDGMPNRYSKVQQTESMLDEAEWQHWGRCQNVKSKLENQKAPCNIGMNGPNASFILWGDSHARALAPAVNKSAQQYGVAGRIATEDACPPLLAVERMNRLSCYEFNAAVMQYISDSPQIKTVILAARWALSAEGMRYKRPSGPTIELVDLRDDIKIERSNIILFEIGLMRTINQLKALGRNVVLVNQVPEVGYDVPSVAFISSISGQEVNSVISLQLNDYVQRMENVTRVFTAIVQRKKDIKIVDPTEVICDEEYCSVQENGISLYRDDHHLSVHGSKYVSHSFDTVFSATIRP